MKNFSQDHQSTAGILTMYLQNVSQMHPVLKPCYILILWQTNPRWSNFF